jgi:galactokinase
MSHDLIRSFVEIFQSGPEIVAAAPGRVNLIGEHVDYNDGFVLPFAIDAVTIAALRIRSDSKIRIFSKQKSEGIFESAIENLEPESGPYWSRYFLGVIWALEVKNGVDILVESKVPEGAGLSSSAALECAIGTALNERLNLGYSLPELARLMQRAENEFVGVPCGIMDQSISLMAKEGHALLLDCRDLAVKQIPVNFAGAGLRLLVIDTGVHHELTDGGYAERRSQCESAAKILGVKSLRDADTEDLQKFATQLSNLEQKRARHVVSEISRVKMAVTALEANDFVKLGKLITESHISLRDDYNVSTPELDLAVTTSLKHGALGSRMVGGGFGGSAIALIKEEDAGIIASQIEIAFKDSGYKPPRFFDSLPSQGARILKTN